MQSNHTALAIMQFGRAAVFDNNGKCLHTLVVESNGRAVIGNACDYHPQFLMSLPGAPVVKLEAGEHPYSTLAETLRIGYKTHGAIMSLIGCIDPNYQKSLHDSFARRAEKALGEDIIFDAVQALWPDAKPSVPFLVPKRFKKFRRAHGLLTNV